MAGNSPVSRALQATYARIAPLYDFLDAPFERGRYSAVRPLVFAEVKDAARLLDCGVGTGRNIPYYPAAARVTGIDLSPKMLDRARRRARQLGRAVDLIEADVLELPFADNSFDAASATFLFCVLPDSVQEQALREIARVVRPGGRIVLLEYVLSKNPWRRRIMKLWAPWVRFAYGAAFDRDTLAHLKAAGLSVEARRFVYADMLLLITARVPG